MENENEQMNLKTKNKNRHGREIKCVTLKRRTKPISNIIGLKFTSSVLILFFRLIKKIQQKGNISRMCVASLFRFFFNLNLLLNKSKMLIKSQ